MKNFRLLPLLCVSLATQLSFSQTKDELEADSTGLAGDHFSLQGALEMFKKSSSLEDFETKINSESNYVNNLDLNDDGKTDYITVNDMKEDNTHAIVLKVAVNESQWQDVAVIELQKDGDNSAVLQIVGDEELYGEKKIVEPFDEAEKEKSGGYGPLNPDFILRPVVVNVWGWSCVRFIFAPLYVPWVSPWRWHYYPVWWSPWVCHPWRWHYMHCYGWHAYYHPCYVARVAAAGVIYAPHRSVSVVVRTRYAPAREVYHNRTMNNKTPNTANENRGREEKQTNTNHQEKAKEATGNHQEKAKAENNNNRKNNNNSARQGRKEQRSANRANRGGRARSAGKAPAPAGGGGKGKGGGGKGGGRR